MLLKKNNKNETKRVSSIARKINYNFTRKLIAKFILLDFIIIISALFLWCYQKEINYFGTFDVEADRGISFNSIDNATYSVSISSGESMKIDASSFLFILEKMIILVLCIELLMVFKQIISGTRIIREKLKPLNEIAETASRLSDITFDEEKVQNLEDAISKISPISSDEKIYTGDSELKGIENSINSLLERMRASYTQQARFVSDASHELRTPIAVIQGYVNMLDRWGKQDEKVLDESIIAIKSESENMKILVEQLLFLARGTNGKTKLNLKSFSLNHMINEVYQESIMIDENHIYKYKKSKEIMVYADEALLKQVVRILTENAAKYTPLKELIIFKSGINNNGEIYFSVQDNGIGMNSEDVSHIFERFFRADTARERKTGGTGLGLSIAKWIVDIHHGYFEVLSREGIGTRITVVLPKNSIN